MAININDTGVQQLHRANSKSLSKSNDGAKNVDTRDNVNKADLDQASASQQKPSDSLTLTDSAINLKKLEDSIAHLPIVDMQKVEEIQNKIKDGSYTINADKIAERFIDMEIALSS